MRGMITVFLFALVLAPACGGKKDDAPAPPATGSAGSSEAGSGSGSGSAAPAEPATPEAALDLPTEVDFEEAAETEISEKNVEKELATIEKELAQ